MNLRAFLVVFTLIALPANAWGHAPLTTLAAVRAVPHAEALQARPVSVIGTVIYFDPTATASGCEGLIMHDGTAGCFVSSEQTTFAARDDIQSGTRIRVTGVTNGTSYFPHIKLASVEILEQSVLPAPRPIHAGELFLPELDSQWIEISAIVTGVEPGGLAFTVVLEINGRAIKGEIPFAPDAEKQIAGSMQRQVRVQAIVGTISNHQRQLTDRHLFIPSFDNIIRVGLPEHGSPPLRKIDTLLQSDQQQDDLVRIRGIVTHQIMGGLYLCDKTGVAFVQTVGEAGYPIGSEVEVEGYACIAPFRPIIRATRNKLTGVTEVLKPTHLDRFDVNVHWHNELVTVDCDFLGIVHSPNHSILRCRSGQRFFEAVMPALSPDKEPFDPGDQLRLTGIYEVTTSRPNPRLEWADGARLLISGSESIELLQHAPWWTLPRVAMVLAAMAAILIGVFIWNALLHRRIGVQAQTIVAQVEEGIVRDERQRIAREWHDTLEQELAGLSIQLGNINAVLRDDNEVARARLSLARNMLNHSRDEARASIIDLRDSQLLERDLPAAMHRCLTAATDATTAQFDFEVDGVPQPLRPATAHHLLRIAGEAVCNAVQHAQSPRIKASLRYDAQGVQLQIQDNGVGFCTDQPPPVGHFGLTGMQERANKIHAHFSIESSPGSGCLIQVALPWSTSLARPETLS